MPRQAKEEILQGDKMDDTKILSSSISEHHIVVLGSNMRHRKNSEEDEGSEMDIDGEAKIGDQELQEEAPDDSSSANEDDSDEEMMSEDDEEDAGRSKMHAAVDNPFMDSFYGLSAADSRERARSAQIMLHHSLLGPGANSKDAAYTLRRLLNGLCSGRAAARQGNASALASFLKIAFHMEKMDEIREEDSSESNKDDNDRCSNLMYIRNRLIAVTDASQIAGRKKGSEERDYQFGRLFGINAVVRSNVILPGSFVGSQDVKDVATALLSDLVELFWMKKWMREPAAHGIATMLNLFLDANDESCKIAQHLIDHVVVPKLLAITHNQTAVEQEKDRQKLLEGYCAEQIGVAAVIHSHPRATTRLFPLDEAVVSSVTLPWIGQALSETSSVVHPRTHFVWDALCSLLTNTEENEKSEKALNSPSKRTLRKDIPRADENAEQVIESILTVVVKEKLLRLEKDTSTTKATHERRSLALCIFRNLSGAPFVSSLAGNVQIVLDGDAMQNTLLSSDIMRALFVQVISGGKQQHSSSLLKPLALEILGTMTEAAVEIGGRRRLSCAEAFLKCDLRFDSRMKTSTVSDLLGFSDGIPVEKEDFSRWDEYIDHLEQKILHLPNVATDSETKTYLIGNIELLYSAAKHILHAGAVGEAEANAQLKQYKKITTQKILNFLMAISFFDCSSVKKPAGAKKKKKLSFSVGLECALKVKKNLNKGVEIPYSLRSTAGARFFSLASDFAIVMASESKDEESVKVEKDSNVLFVLASLCDGWKEMEVNGAKRYSADSSSTEADDELSDPEAAVTKLRERVSQTERSVVSDTDSMLKVSQKRCGTGIAVLALTLHLHRLHCGSDDSMEEDPDSDLENDEEEICNAIDGLDAVATDFIDKIDLSNSNPLLGLAELCANILSSPLGSGSIGRGSSPKLVREAVRFAWLGGLRLASSMSTKEKSLLDTSVIDILMEAVGADIETNVAEDGDNEVASDDEESDAENSENNSDDEGIFVKAAKEFNDPEHMESEDSEAPDDHDEASEIEINSTSLQTMLEDSDVDEDIELEHHEGADAALAKLIKLKQEARKAGQQAREKIEVSDQLRCTLFLECLLGRPDAWSGLFRGSVLEMVMPLLLHRKKVARMVEKAAESGSMIGKGEKKALLERLTSLIKQKLCKLRLSAMPFASSIDTDLGKELIRQILKEARGAKDKEQVSCCSSCLVMVLRALPSSPEVISAVSSEYGKIVLDWSTKRSSGASIFEDLIVHFPTMAQVTLLSSLDQAALQARSPFLKVESFRLLSLLFAARPNPDISEVDALAKQSILACEQNILETIATSLKDDEMKKSKRVRSVLKALEKFLPLLSAPASSEVVSALQTLKSLIEGLGVEDGSKKGTSRSAATAKYSALIDQKLKDLQSSSAVTTTRLEKQAHKAKKTNKKKKKR